MGNAVNSIIVTFVWRQMGTTPNMVSTKKCIGLLNHYVVHLKLIQHHMLTKLQLGKKKGTKRLGEVRGGKGDSQLPCQGLQGS